MGSDAADATPGRWWVYMIRCRDGTLYTGIATDVDRRFEEHGQGKGARYVRGRAPLELVYRRLAGTRSAALRLERRIKKSPRENKEGFLTDDSLVTTWLEDLSQTE